MTRSFGNYIRRRRLRLLKDDADYSIRRVARRMGIQPAYLSKVERGEVAPPSERRIIQLAGELNEDADALLAMAGKVATDITDTIRKHPELFAKLIRTFKKMPAHKARNAIHSFTTSHRTA